MANTAILKGVEFHTGDKVKVSQKIQEGGKTRIQAFEGIVLAISGGGENQSFCVRKISTGKVGVERIWPVKSPWIDGIEILKKGVVRRAKIFYARDQRVKLKFKDDKKTARPRQTGRKTSPKKASK